MHMQFQYLIPDAASVTDHLCSMDIITNLRLIIINYTDNLDKNCLLYSRREIVKQLISGKGGMGGQAEWHYTDIAEAR